jgi:galactokinase
MSLDKGKPEEQWACYIYGVAAEMVKRGKVVKGFNAVYGGDVPFSAGISSSAALESVFALALNDLFDLGFTLPELAKIGQMTEHNFVGIHCGIMNQFASLCGQENKVLKLDCRSLDYELIPFKQEGYKLVLIDTMVKHSLAFSEYNIRRGQCEAGWCYSDG